MQIYANVCKQEFNSYKYLRVASNLFKNKTILKFLYRPIVEIEDDQSLSTKAVEKMAGSRTN